MKMKLINFKHCMTMKAIKIFGWWWNEIKKSDEKSFNAEKKSLWTLYRTKIRCMAINEIEFRPTQYQFQSNETRSKTWNVNQALTISSDKTFSSVSDISCAGLKLRVIMNDVKLLLITISMSWNLIYESESFWSNFFFLYKYPSPQHNVTVESVKPMSDIDTRSDGFNSTQW